MALMPMFSGREGMVGEAVRGDFNAEGTKVLGMIIGKLVREIGEV